MASFSVGKFFLQHCNGFIPIRFKCYTKSIRQSHMIKIGHLHEVKIVRHPEFIQLQPQKSRFLGRSQPAQLVQRHLEFKTPAAKTGGSAAGNVVPFQQQYI